MGAGAPFLKRWAGALVTPTTADPSAFPALSRRRPRAVRGPAAAPARVPDDSVFVLYTPFTGLFRMVQNALSCHFPRCGIRTFRAAARPLTCPPTPKPH